MRGRFGRALVPPVFNPAPPIAGVEQPAPSSSAEFPAEPPPITPILDEDGQPVRDEEGSMIFED